MSLEIVLVPLALAAFSAWKSSKQVQEQDGRTVCHVGSRMRNEELLWKALTDCGAAVAQQESSIVATWSGVQAQFMRDGQGIWTAHLTGEVDEARGLAIITAVDTAYGRHVQQTVLETLRARAGAAGMSVESESKAADESVTVVLTVGVGV